LLLWPQFSIQHRLPSQITALALDYCLAHHHTDMHAAAGSLGNARGKLSAGDVRIDSGRFPAVARGTERAPERLSPEKLVVFGVWERVIDNCGRYDHRMVGFERIQAKRVRLEMGSARFLPRTAVEAF